MYQIERGVWQPSTGLKHSGEKRKFVNSITNTAGFISKAVREIYPSLTNKPAENSEFREGTRFINLYV